MASDGGKKYILSDVEDFAKKNSFNDTFKIAKTWEEIGFHVSALSYNGFKAITLSRWGSGVFQLFFSGDTFLKTRYSLGAIHAAGITQWTKDYIDNPYGIQRVWFNIKNGYQKDDKYHYKEFLKNKNKVNTNENMKKQTIRLNESQLRNIIKKSINEAVCEDEYDLPWQDREPKNDMDKIRYSRYQGLVEIIEFYSAQDDEGKSLSKEQCEQLKNACDTIECFGELGQGWAEIGRDILSKNEHVSINESQLRNIIKESIKKVLRENFRKPENWKDTPFKGTYQDEDGSIYMPDDDYEVIDEENK